MFCCVTISNNDVIYANTIDCVTIETINDNNNNLLYKLVIFTFFNLGTRITGA